MSDRLRGLEWPTLVLLVICYALWALGTTWASGFWLPLGMALVVFSAALHSSLTHEALHGHPFRNPVLNAALVFPALSLAVPYLRFRDTHLAHHRESILTDPYDDPESNFMDPGAWAGLPRWMRAVLRVNNTLAGRMALGPLIGTLVFIRSDLRAIRDGDRRVLAGWLWHLPAMGIVIVWMAGFGQMPVWAWLVSTYMALSVLKVRTFLEHRADQDAAGRTVIVEDRGLLALLFLNNNLHMVHHMHAMVPWYRLPRLYHADRDRYLSRNGGYRYTSYGQIFCKYLWRAKDPVPHPLWPKP